MTWTRSSTQQNRWQTRSTAAPAFRRSFLVLRLNSRKPSKPKCLANWRCRLTGIMSSICKWVNHRFPIGTTTTSPQLIIGLLKESMIIFLKIVATKVKLSASTRKTVSWWTSLLFPRNWAKRTPGHTKRVSHWFTSRRCSHSIKSRNTKREETKKDTKSI